MCGDLLEVLAWSRMMRGMCKSRLILNRMLRLQAQCVFETDNYCRDVLTGISKCFIDSLLLAIWSSHATMRRSSQFTSFSCREKLSQLSTPRSTPYFSTAPQSDFTHDIRKGHADRL